MCLLKGLSGDLGLERVKDAVMQALPSDVTDLDASDALSSLDVISGAVWFKYVKEEGQSIMATVKGALSDIAGSRDVRCASSVIGSTPYYMEIKRRFWASSTNTSHSGRPKYSQGRRRLKSCSRTSSNASMMARYCA